MSSTTLMAAPPETWGQRFQRCRKAVLSSAELVEALLDGFVGRATLGRLEQLEEVPSRKRARQQATTVLVLCGYDPEAFGLSMTDLPSFFNAEVLADLRVTASGWISAYEVAA